MKLRKLEMALEKVEGFESPNVGYEQYKTPAVVAAPFLHLAFMSGDIEGKTVYDLGCGTGILSIGAAILGASEVTGFDIDESAVLGAKNNAALMCSEIQGSESEFDIDFIVSNVSNISEKIESGELKRADTILMNPPFGAQEKGNDRPFLEAALAAGNVIYSIHNKGSRAFIEKFIKPAVVTDCFITDFPIRKTFDFHKKDILSIDVEIYRIESRR
ncbi:METTL5 family protein [Methanimicrococcus blatticola]|uniref:Methyltransferase n=1 Tax=Methanimicrococcus blatticola TaxID=91560 RepID=A0A484F638_9EURY|nr:METTL5 family protein [Methanimicrococcus blatticola]MBZ3935759.1 METTL5 family protein [Methanimicrococcus blatticola]MCC2508121.1 METTL5 family protein [Methanimicrococcus blatticola]TDQ68800.1 methyltransferase [Methanimicrococcus blatticola]